MILLLTILAFKKDFLRGRSNSLTPRKPLVTVEHQFLHLLKNIEKKTGVTKVPCFLEALKNLQLQRPKLKPQEELDAARVLATDFEGVEVRPRDQGFCGEIDL